MPLMNGAVTKIERGTDAQLGVAMTSLQNGVKKRDIPAWASSPDTSRTCISAELSREILAGPRESEKGRRYEAQVRKKSGRDRPVGSTSSKDSQKSNGATLLVAGQQQPRNK